jgi:hypothetical protein
MVWQHKAGPTSSGVGANPQGKIKTVVEEMDELPLEELEALALESVPSLHCSKDIAMVGARMSAPCQQELPTSSDTH